MNSGVILFLREMVQRLFTKSPLFFKIWQIISGTLTVVTGIPQILEFLGVALPPPFDTLANKAVAAASTTALFMSMLATKSEAVAVTKEGEILKKTDEEKLPFTAKAEEKAETKKPDGILNPETPMVTETVEVARKINMD